MKNGAATPVVLACSTLWLCVNQFAHGFYIPGNAPNAYDQGAKVPVQANKLESTKTQVPYSYYSLDYCRPERMETAEANLGQILHGDLMQNTPYEVHMKVDDPCIKLCSQLLKNDSLAAFKGMIDDEYYASLYADFFPAALVVRSTPFTGSMDFDGNRPEVIVSGFPVGYKVELPANGSAASAGQPATHYYLVNHLDMTLYWHSTAEGNRVVGFEIEPKSRAYDPSDGELKCEDTLPSLDLDALTENQTMLFTYSVTWQYSAVSWATRWDAYLRASAGIEQIHWFSLVNSFGVVVILSTIVAMILVRTLVRDIARYNNLEDIEEAQEESGWKLIHGDVFRRPNFSKLLATCTGTGIQVLIMAGLTLGFSLLGVLSPANRGALLQAMLILFAFMGGPAGYVSARFNKLFQGDKERSFIVTLWTAFQYVGVCFTTFLVMNVILWAKSSTGAIPFKWIFLLVVLWLGVSVPLVFVGAYMGYRKPVLTVPCRVNAIPRQIPKPPLLLSTPVVLLAGGILPFGAVFSEISVIMASVWQHRFYYLFGFLTLTLVVLVVTCAEASIVFTYFQLTSEDYRWWWRSYWIAAFSAVYLAVFCVIYFFEALEIKGFASSLLYFGYSALMCYTFFIVTGAVGFVSTFGFVHAIYGAIKVD